MSILENFVKLDSSSPISICVIGDAMIDEYFDVKVKKISPEFPIPVMHSETDESEHFPGGAANTAYQFKNFNAKVKLVSFLDKEAKKSFVSKGLDTSLCLEIDKLIPRKRRFYSDGFPTYRWDVEEINYGLGSELTRKCYELFYKLLNDNNKFDVIIFSDYNKGIFSSYLFNLIGLKEAISIVDPKAGDITRWQNCSVFKPNAQEALALSGCKTIKDAGNFLLDKLECKKAVVITDGGKGVTVFDHEGLHEIKPTEKLPPAESVIGGGDCFTSFLAMALAREIPIRKAAEVAWKAGNIYVKNRHNKPIAHLDLINTYDKSIGKIITNPEDFFKNKDYKLVATGGCFDLFHCGHLETLRFAKSCGDKLVVLINSDISVKNLKGPNRPVISLEQRAKIIASIEYVDFVVVFDDPTPRNVLGLIKPDIFVKGASYNIKDIQLIDGVKDVILCPIIDGLSTTKIIEKLNNG